MCNCKGQKTRDKGFRRGFTLAEILCVVVILGIASAVVVPNLGTRNDLIAGAAAREMMADLMYAQNKAIVGQAMVYVKFDTTAQQYSLTTTAPNVTAVYVPNPATQKNMITAFSSATNSSFKSVSLQAVNVDTKSCLAFDELGQPYAVDNSTGVATLLVNNATMPLRCGTFTVTVNVEPYTGAMTMQ
jgi:prepilin-type N-terminal cleavage/methylation domain-containing protein